MTDLFVSRVLRHFDTDLGQLADHALDVAADIADLGKFRGFDLYERGIGYPGKAAGDLSLADTSRSDHQDIFGKHILRDLVRKLLPSNAIAQGDRHGLFCGRLTDDVPVKLL